MNSYLATLNATARNSLVTMSKKRFDDVYYGLVVDAYELFHPEGNLNDVPFYAELIRQRPGRVLELMCGSGRVLLPLLRQGFTVDGTDSSPEMLARCKSNAEAEGLNPELYEQFAHELRLSHRYCTILLTYSSFALLTHRDEAFEVLRFIHAHLEEGGQFLLDMAIPWVHHNSVFGAWQLSRQGVLPNGRSVLVSRAATVEHLNQIETVHVRYEVYDEGCLIETLLTPMKMRFYGMHELILLLEKAGFSNIQTFGGFQQREVQEGDGIITFQCFK
ncbi:methyltransferase domain-containing protein [Chamaesiphon sp. OTE_20_metabat_361]|uniref:class I SAM-dependent methyltransferase n=1 Tax=Chamaesiphon sp. OTE_20_metabat_361 TaxID=2964689 RepID=UPI00286B2652|nr:methyltransferase domain-containing protein [Chamaesiphon sp. OTE_20_metabat_361]